MQLLPKGWEINIAKLVAGIVIILVALWVWRFLRKLMAKAENKDGGKTAVGLCLDIIRVFVFVWAACGVCDVWFDMDLVSVIEALGVTGIAISLGAQQTIANIIGGIIISLSTMIHKGDWVVVHGQREGKLVDTNWRCTTLEDEKGVRYLVPNTEMVSSVVEIAQPYRTIILSFELRAKVADINGLLHECEQLMLDSLKEIGADYEELLPQAMINRMAFGALQTQIELYANRTILSDTVQQELYPVLLDFLKERGALY